MANNIYTLKENNTESYLIHGDGRELKEIKNNSIDCIITDHPWENNKANIGGNKSFIDYNTFQYNIEDFRNKYRVLKDGCYLVEFLPVESATNWEYLTNIKQMAKEVGFLYYCQLLWRKAPEGSINTGRTTKE